MVQAATYPEQRSEFGAAIHFRLLESTVDRESRVEIAGRGGVVENHSTPFPWIFRKHNPGKI
jgi:hypothetical protein